MANLIAKVLYDYTQKNSTELTVTAEETIYIIDKDSGNSFSKVRNVNGEEGLVPTKVYVFKRGNKVIKDDNVSEDDVPNIGKKENSFDYYDSLTVSEINSANNLKRAHRILEETVTFGTFRMRDKSLSEITPIETEIASDIEAKVEIVIEESKEISKWKPLGEFQKCQIVSYGVDSKGKDKFITYQLKSSNSEKCITRNFKEYDWFRFQLKDKFPCIVIPPLPSNQLMTNFKTKSVEEGQKQLQLWLSYILDHPVLTSNEFIKSFLQGEELKMIQNKKVAYDFKSREFYDKVDAPTNGIDWNNYSQRIYEINSFIESLDKHSSGLQGYNRVHKDSIEQICKIYGKFGNAINNVYVALSLNPDNDENDKKFYCGIHNVSIVYEKIGTLFNDQAKTDADLIEDSLAEIISVTKEMPTIMDIPKCIIKTVTKNIDCKLDTDTKKEIDRNIQVIARTIDAELHWLKNRRNQQLKSMMTQYLTNQINLFTGISAELKNALSQLDN